MVAGQPVFGWRMMAGHQRMDQTMKLDLVEAVPVHAAEEKLISNAFAVSQPPTAASGHRSAACWAGRKSAARSTFHATSSGMTPDPEPDSPEGSSVG